MSRKGQNSHCFIATLQNGLKAVRVITQERGSSRRGSFTGRYERRLLLLSTILARVMVVLFTLSFALALPVHLIWDTAPVSELVTGYNVHRSTTIGSGYVKLTEIPITAPDYIDDPSGPGPWYYVVTAINSAGESTFSNEVLYRNVPLAPKNLRIAPASVRSWPDIEPTLNKFGAALVGSGASVDETQVLAWSGFGAELVTIANTNIQARTAQPFNLQSILNWAISKNLIEIGSGGFYGWSGIVSFH